MSIPDKLAAANKINGFLQAVVTHGGLRLKYRIVVDPPLPENRDWEKPEILVDFTGPDSAMLLDRGGELSARPRTACARNAAPAFRASTKRSASIARISVAAHSGTSHRCHALPPRRCAAPGTPYEFSPMSSRERRIVHLALRDEADLHTESEGEGMRRCLVVYPKDYKPAGKPAPRMLP